MGRPMPAAEFARWSTGWSTRQAMTISTGKGPDIPITLH